MTLTPLKTVLFDYAKINVHWFPSHMSAGVNEMRRMMKKVDLVLEVRDARILQPHYIPQSSASPVLAPFARGKEHFIVFAKADLADPASNARLEAFAQQEWPGRSFIINAMDPRSLHSLMHQLARTVREKLCVSDTPSKPASIPTSSATKRLLIVGIPNVGKSSLLNQLRALGTGRGGKATRTGDLPGVTRRLSGAITLLEGPPRLMMLDTPGILMPRIHDVEQGMKLAITGAIMDAVLNDHLLADYLLHILQSHMDEASYARALGLERTPRNALELVEAVSRASGWPSVNTHNAVMKMLRAFRDGKLGKFTLDSIPSREIKESEVPVKGA